MPEHVTRPLHTRTALLLALAPMLALACRRAEVEATPPATQADSQPVAVRHDQAGRTVVVLTEEAIATAGIETAAPTPTTITPHVRGYGVVEADPARSAVLRAPLDGRLVAKEGWPVLGSRVEAGDPLAVLEPRVHPLSPQERIGLETQREAARGAIAARAAEVEAARKELARVEALNAADKAAPDRAVEAARSALAVAQAQQSYQERVSASLDAVLSQPLPALAPLVLPAPMSGEVVALPASPGEELVAGADVLALTDPTVVLARVSLPVGEPAPAPGSSPRVAPVGAPEEAHAATLVGPVASATPTIAGVLLLRVEDATGVLRPGTRVLADFPSGEPAAQGLRVPRGAVVRHAGQAWVYVELDPGEFGRRPVKLADVQGQPVVVEGLAPEQRIVSVGAQLLLSHELLSAGGSGGEEEED